MRKLLGAVLLFSSLLAGCGGGSDCKAYGKAACERFVACGGTAAANSPDLITTECAQAFPCAGSVDASECITAADNQSCADVLAGAAVRCTAHCK
jgi:hypothetical protein